MSDMHASNDQDPGAEQPPAAHGSEAMRRADTANGERPDVEGADDPEPKHSRVLIAVDGSDPSLRVAKTARDLFGGDAKYFVINVGADQVEMVTGEPMALGVPYPMAFGAIAMPSTLGSHVSSAAADLPSAIDMAEQSARSVSTAAELPAGSVALGATGDPVDRIRQAAEVESIDVIVVGASSGHWWRHMFDTSVSKGLMKHTDRPVLLVP